MKKDLYKKIFAPSDCLSQSMLIGYLKGNLTEEDTHRAEEHLVDCELCTEALEGLMLVKNESNLSALRDDVKKTIHAKENKRKTAPAGFYLMAAAAVAIIILSVFAIRFVTNISNDQLAIHEEKNITKDTTGKNSVPVKEENNSSEENLTTETGDINKVENESDNVPKPPVPRANENLIVTNQNKEATAEIAKDDMPEDMHEEIFTFEQQENKSIERASTTSKNENQSRKQSAGNIAATQTRTEKIQYNAPAAASIADSKTETDNNLSAYVYDLKIYNYDKEVNTIELMSVPEKSTEAQFATPEEKESVAKALHPEAEVSYKDKIAPALKAYKEKNFNGAIALLSPLLNNNSGDVNVYFYKGMSFFNLKNYKKAIDYLQLLTRDNNNIFYEESKFYLALCYLENNQEAKARSLLREIAGSSSFYNERASQKLKEIE